MRESATCMDHYSVDFIPAFNLVAAFAHDLAVEKGFWDNERNVGEMVALIHSELSEGFEGYRNGNPPDSHIDQFNSLEVELADTIIRIMDLATGKKLRVAEALCAKLIYNQSRPYKHGKNF